MERFMFLILTCDPDKWAEESDEGKYEEVEIFAFIVDKEITRLRLSRNTIAK